MKKIKNIDEAIKFLQERAGINVELMPKVKWNIFDQDIGESIENISTFKTDEDLIDYANEQKEAIED